MRDARTVLQARMDRNGWSLRDVAEKTEPRVTAAALSLFLKGTRPGWKVATAVGGILRWTPDRVLRSVNGSGASDAECGAK